MIKLQAKRFELYFLLKLSDPKSTFRLTPGLTKLSFEQPRPVRKAKYFPIQPNLTGSISTLSCERRSFLVFLYKLTSHGTVREAFLCSRHSVPPLWAYLWQAIMDKSGRDIFFSSRESFFPRREFLPRVENIFAEWRIFSLSRDFFH